jgi:glutathione S-transferase
MAQPQLKLTYFDFKGRAELTRMIFHYGGVAFTDTRVARADFPTLKPKLPFGQVPILEVDNTVYSQSMAIARYAAKISGLYPAQALQALEADMFSCALTEVVEAFVGFASKMADEAGKAQKKKLFAEETVPTMFGALEKMVRGKFVLGDDMSYVDVQLLDLVENAVLWAIPTFEMKPFPKLAAVVANVKADPKINAYLAQRTQQ